jgi:hypothetical protein
LAIRTLKELSSFNFPQHLLNKKKVDANKDVAIPLHIPQVFAYLWIMISNVKYCIPSNFKGDRCKQFDSIGFPNNTS